MIDDANRARIKLAPRSEQTVCPYSGTIAANKEFLHPDDRQAAIKTVEHAALEDMTDAVHSMFDGLKRRPGAKKYADDPDITAAPAHEAAIPAARSAQRADLRSLRAGSGQESKAEKAR